MASGASRWRRAAAARCCRRPGCTRRHRTTAPRSRALPGRSAARGWRCGGRSRSGRGPALADDVPMVLPADHVREAGVHDLVDQHDVAEQHPGAQQEQHHGHADELAARPHRSAPGRVVRETRPTMRPMKAGRVRVEDASRPPNRNRPMMSHQFLAPGGFSGRQRQAWRAPSGCRAVRVERSRRGGA